MSGELSFFETAGKAFINMLAMVVYPYGFESIPISRKYQDEISRLL
ncbi:MAG: hypothetical protein IKA34_02785 [Bacteroidales bacterium]|nr:hypothetical protein [Bacteroidales bacterium]